MNKSLATLLEILPFEQSIGSKEIMIDNITLDSRIVTPTTIFIAQRGESVDGHDFIPTAIENGARVIICEVLPEDTVALVTYIVVTDSHYAAGIIASWFYNFPATQLTLVGVTGTNGKTTVATLLWQALQLLGNKTGLLSTVSYWIDDKEFPSTHTTPDAVSLQKLFRAMVDAGCSHVVMEVSSHAIVQKRIAGLTFRAGIFTNLTQDHLDFHKTMEAYRDAKKAFFTGLPTTACAITNVDDTNGIYMIDATAAKKVSYSVIHDSQYQAKNITLSTHGSTFMVNNTEITQH